MDMQATQPIDVPVSHIQSHRLKTSKLDQRVLKVKRLSSQKKQVAIPITPQCMQRVSELYRIPVPILKWIKHIEGAYPGHIRKNNNNTYDIGVMQINTKNWKKFTKHGISVSDLQWNGCISLSAAAHLLREHYDLAISKNKLNTWDQLIYVTARYHSKTPKFNKAYQHKLRDAIKTIGVK